MKKLLIILALCFLSCEPEPITLVHDVKFGYNNEVYLMRDSNGDWQKHGNGDYYSYEIQGDSISIESFRVPIKVTYLTDDVSISTPVDHYKFKLKIQDSGYYRIRY